MHMNATISPVVLVHQSIGALFLPPLCFIWLALLGVWFVSRGGIYLALLLCYALSTPYVAGQLTRPLEIWPAISASEASKVDAIVVLGGGRREAPEYGGLDVGSDDLQRLSYAAWLARQSGKPILVTGGPLQATSDAELMARALKRNFGVEARWIEPASSTTLENAQFSARILLPAGMKHIALVSHAWHLRRAVPFFQQQGFEVLPAPTGFFSSDFPLPLQFLPSGSGMQGCWTALREWVGIAYYRVLHE
jgi:uncharacterized SAM-binding protein YcdF (DUF218 family)